jgi:hypothetical protein
VRAERAKSAGARRQFAARRGDEGPHGPSQGSGRGGGAPATESPSGNRPAASRTGRGRAAACLRGMGKELAPDRTGACVDRHSARPWTFGRGYRSRHAPPCRTIAGRKWPARAVRVNRCGVPDGATSRTCCPGYNTTGGPSASDRGFTLTWTGNAGNTYNRLESFSNRRRPVIAGTAPG